MKLGRLFILGQQKYFKNLVDWDISSTFSGVMHNICVMQYRNRFNNLTVTYYYNKLKPLEKFQFNSEYGILYGGGQLLDDTKLDFNTVLRLKTMISWRLRNVWESNRYWLYLYNKKNIMMMTNNIQYCGNINEVKDNES